jgi:hypothetical protein
VRVRDSARVRVRVMDSVRLSVKLTFWREVHGDIQVEGQGLFLR